MIRRGGSVGSLPLGRLTSIPQRIHCAATQQVGTLSETDGVHLNHFFNTLADVSLSVAKRRLTSGQVTGTCAP